MKWPKQNTLFLISAIALIGCSTAELKVPVGVYRENSTPNFLDVSTNTMRVHIEGWDQKDTNGTGIIFEYVLWPNGRLWLVVSRSAELFYGYPALEYRWDGEKIVATDSKSERKWEFAR